MRGGKRVGAGVKAADGAVLTTKITVNIDDAAYELIMELGDGNPSIGARRAFAELIRLRAGPVKSISKRVALKPIRKIIPAAGADGVKLHFMKHAALQDAADEEYARALKVYENVAS